MSRLLDRILTSCQRFRPSMLDREEFEAEVFDQLRQRFGPNIPGKILTKVYDHEGVHIYKHASLA